MATRQHKNTAQYSPLPLPLAGTEQVEVWRDGKQYQTTLDVLGGNPGPHGESHESGTDKIGTQTPTADAVVRGDDNGQVNDWVANASTSVKGKVQLATDGESAASKAVQANDSRLSNSRTPTAHAASHLGGTDDLGLGTAALLDVGVADGVCGLDSSGKVGSAFLPSYVDDVIEVANFAALPVTGETGKIYVTLNDNLTYRWSGSAYVEISKSLAIGETSSTAYRGDRGKTAYDHSQTAHAPSNADNTQAAIVAASSKATPVDADTLALIDSEAGSALKELLWSSVKATLKTYFDTLYSGSSGETAESILTKLLTVDGYTSGLVSEDSGKLGGVLLARLIYGDNSSGSQDNANADTILKCGFYRFINGTPPPGWPSAFQGFHYQNPLSDSYAAQFAFGATGTPGIFYRTKAIGVWTGWVPLYNSGNVGTNWPTALAAAYVDALAGADSTYREKFSDTTVRSVSSMPTAAGNYSIHTFPKLPAGSYRIDASFYQTNISGSDTYIYLEVIRGGSVIYIADGIDDSWNDASYSFTIPTSYTDVQVRIRKATTLNTSGAYQLRWVKLYSTHIMDTGREAHVMSTVKVATYVAGPV